MLGVLNLASIPILVGVLAITLRWWYNKLKYNLPPGPTGVPILGYLPFMDDQPFKVFKRLSEQYGKIFSLYLGRSYVVVLNDFDSLKDAFSQPTLADRPPDIFSFHPDGLGLTGMNGQEWVEQRRYAFKALKDIGIGKSHWEEIMEEEINDLMKVIESYEGKPVHIIKHLTASVSNNVISLLFGKRLLMDDPRREIFDEEVHAVSEVFGQTGMASNFPLLLKFIAMLGISEFAKMRQKMLDFNNFVRGEVGYHKSLPPSANGDNFISGYLKEIQKNKNGNTYFTETNLLGNVQTLTNGGSETLATSMLWLLLAVASYPEVQKKVEEEIGNVLGRDGKPNWVDRSKMPYTYATIMECQRWRTVAPLLLMHRASADSKVGGFDIPKGTNILGNSWALHNDPKYWNNPERFQPERFLEENGQLKAKKFDSYIPFSTGKRVCPGEVVALIEIFHYFIALIQNFQILPPSDGEILNLTGTHGATYQPLPQSLRFIPKS